MSHTSPPVDAPGDHPGRPTLSNTGQQTFADVLVARLSRRGLLAGGLATAAATFLSGGPGSALFASPAGAVGGPVAGKAGTLLGFTAVGTSQADDVIVPDGYRYQVLIPWGTPLLPGAPPWRPDASNTAADQELQVGSNHDGMHFFPLSSSNGTDDGNRRGLLCINHEYTDEWVMFPDGTEAYDAEKTRKSQAAHGVSVIEIELVGGEWQVAEGSMYHRRITGFTPTTFSGPAAGHPLLRTSVDPTGMSALGTLNNCANGWTPWGTYLTCEENFNQYFSNLGEGEITADQAALLKRYGVPEESEYLWYTTDERFRADLEPNEPNRFGWVVEINPWVPGSLPIKRTALGRVKHEGAASTTDPDGRVVVYCGDDERFEHVYKFVSARPWRHVVGTGASPLDEGTLYVARFDADGSGTWLPLVWDEGPLTPAGGFADQGEVLIKTRMAAEALGATRMDRPEWAAVAPNKEVFMTFTNNTSRKASEVDPANPRPENAYGHILRWHEADDDASATSFTWDVFLLAGKGEGTGDGSTVAADAAFGSPDGLWVDPDYRVWILTDGSQPVPCNNQLLVADPFTGEVRRFLVGPKGCEITGIHATPDQRHLFVNVQHPGDAGTPEDPTAQSDFPDRDPAGRPRSCTLVISRVDGGVVGS